MPQLIGRDSELADLDRAWQRVRSGVPQLAVLWGRRRVGKTFLLTHFAEGKRTVFFTATRQDSAERQLARLAERMREQLGTAVDDLLAAPFRDWEAARQLAAQIKSEAINHLDRYLEQFARNLEAPEPVATGLGVFQF